MSPLLNVGSTAFQPTTCVESGNTHKAGMQQKAQHLVGTPLDLVELIAVWPELPGDVRSEILLIAERAVEQQMAEGGALTKPTEGFR